MKIRLLSKAWNKAFRAGENPAKLVEDMGTLKGYAQVTKYDPITGRILSTSDKMNTLVNTAKTNMIRLISQGQSSHIGVIDPSTHKISRMRFSNNVSTGVPSKLLYYSLTEPAYRGCVPTSGDINAGGSPNSTYPDGYDTNSIVDYAVANIAGNYVVGATSNIKIFSLRNETTGGTLLIDQPPSHNNFKVELYKSSVLVETIYFYEPTNLSNIHVYTRGVQNPYIVVTAGAVGVITANKIMAPTARDYDFGSVGYNNAHIVLSGDHSATYLFFDYNDGVWKFQLEELAGTSTNYDTIKFVFHRGNYNVINSVVPRDGYNVGNGTTLSTRYSNNSAGDYYPILSDIEYRDGDIDYVDDYSCTFSVNMAGQYGNGVTTLVSEYIKYREAFLFNGRDDMFSALYLAPTADFDKNPLTAFFVSWTILAPIG